MKTRDETATKTLEGQTAATAPEIARAIGFLEELKLGVEGHSPEANAERFIAAQETEDCLDRRDDLAYAAALWPNEPEMQPRPFGLGLVLKHQGDLSAVVTDTAITTKVIIGLGLDQYEREISDEEGTHHELVDPSLDPAADDLIDGTVRALRRMVQNEAHAVLATAVEASK